MDNIKAFDLSRFAKLPTENGGHCYIVPSDAQSFFVRKDGSVQIQMKEYDLSTTLSIEEIESEFNRAIGEMESAVSRVAKQVEGKIRQRMGITDSVLGFDPEGIN